MNKAQFSEAIKNFPETRGKLKLKKVIRSYPYFYLAQLIESKQENTKDFSSLAILAPDREQLYRLFNPVKEDVLVSEDIPVKEDVPVLENISEKEDVAEKEDISVPEVVSEEILPAKEPILEIDVEKEEPVIHQVAVEKDDPMAILQQRLREIQNESASSAKKEESKEENKAEEEVSLDELVEKFNSTHPKISSFDEEVEEHEVYEDLCKTSVYEKTNITSETLAILYKNQGCYDKAIKIYKSLSEKNPEKSSTFARSIEELKELKNNQSSKEE